MSEWISINTRLPKEGFWVLCAGGNIGSVDYGCVIDDKFYMHGDFDKPMRWVTHWMALPEGIGMNTAKIVDIRPKMEWISVNNRLPMDKQDVFIWKSFDSEDLTKGWFFGTYIEGKGVYSYGNLKARPMKEFSHWMPEMEPPQQTKEPT